MGRHKIARNVEIRPWLSRNPDCKEGRFIQIGNSLLLSKEFQALSPGAGRLYLCMAMESGGKKEFAFTHGTGKKYGIASSSYDRYVKELHENGFIERVQDPEQMQYSPGVFCFSLAWKSIESAPHSGEGKAQNLPQNGEGRQSQHR